MRMDVIDFRLRPAYRGIEQALRGFGDVANVVGMDEMLAQMDALSITAGVAPARPNDLGLSGRFGVVSNDDIESLVAEYPGRFHGFLGIDADDIDGECARLHEIGAPWFRGVSIEPALCDEPVFMDDARFDPLYEWCRDHGMPLLITLGGLAGPDIEHANPVYLDRVAGRFPDLSIIVSHACWPWIDEAIGVAYRRPNVYHSPDLFLLIYGGARFVEAANSFLGERILFASRWPAITLEEAVRRHSAMGFDPKILPGTLAGNAKRVLGLG
jgi:hypothetical protein